MSKELETSVDEAHHQNQQRTSHLPNPLPSMTPASCSSSLKYQLRTCTPAGPSNTSCRATSKQWGICRAPYAKTPSSVTSIKQGKYGFSEKNQEQIFDVGYYTTEKDSMHNHYAFDQSPPRIRMYVYQGMEGSSPSTHWKCHCSSLLRCKLLSFTAWPRHRALPSILRSYLSSIVRVSEQHCAHTRASQVQAFVATNFWQIQTDVPWLDTDWWSSE